MDDLEGMASTFQPPAAQPDSSVAPPSALPAGQSEYGLVPTDAADTTRVPVVVPPTSGSGSPGRVDVPSRSPGTDPIVAGRAGQAWAYERLFKTYAPNVRAFAAARGAVDPDGLANEVFAEAFRSLQEFRGAEPEFKGFVFHIARRRLIDEYRKKSRRPKEKWIGHTFEAEDPADQYSGSVATSNAMRLVGDLTADQRDVIFLRVLCDLSIDQTAQALGKAPTAVKALQRRAINALRKKIEEEGVS
ncbi:MAG: RNA polymerase sigma factor [Acidimicrobiales bacterium]